MFGHRGDVVEKSHIQHAIGFIQHEGVEAFEREIAARQMVHHPSGCTHHHVRAMLQGGPLAAQRDTTTQRHHLDVLFGARQTPNFAGHLVCQFPCGTQHQRLHREPARVEFGQHGQRKGCSLATTSLGLGNQVFAGQRDGQTGRLDGRHLQVTELLQICQHGGRERQGREDSHTCIIDAGSQSTLFWHLVCYLFSSYLRLLCGRWRLIWHKYFQPIPCCQTNHIV